MNADLEYPWWYELAWIASDADGKLAAFITAGEGPVPKDIFPFVADAELAGVLDKLPVRGPAHSHQVRPTDYFMELAERGFFTFDWDDVHAAKEVKTNAYEKCASPSNPIYTSELVGALAELSILVRFNELRFEEVSSVKPNLFYACRYPEDN